VVKNKKEYEEYLSTYAQGNNALDAPGSKKDFFLSRHMFL